MYVVLTVLLTHMVYKCTMLSASKHLSLNLKFKHKIVVVVFLLNGKDHSAARNKCFGDS